MNALLTACWLASAAAAPAPAADPKDKLDLSADLAKLAVVTDGKGHYVVFFPEKAFDGPLLYGDDKVVWSQRVYGGGAVGTESFNASYWDPRGQASFDFRDDAYSVSCGQRKTELKLLGKEETKAFLAKVALMKTKWKHQAHRLARDDSGNYYFIDRMRDEFGNERRIWVGPRGKMKRLQMTNLVADSEGEIYSTKSGEYRFVGNLNEAKWVAGKKETKLTQVPVEANVAMIYGELGVYEKEKLGTPCDDL
jgi:hypothetical protein